MTALAITVSAISVIFAIGVIVYVVANMILEKKESEGENKPSAEPTEST